jgi:hypothetical protein
MCVGSGVCQWVSTEQLAKQVEIKSLQ